ncbi:MAG: 4a-hydroxytetrahydrobiopterin dehydratase [Nocardioidaceae bacterium]|nr:4a-hydroxytetrahydrobiopterin dehydratase [Nocardioidaceae bacterium]
MTERMTAAAFSEQGLDDWRVIGRGAEANFHCGSYGSAGRFAAELAVLCDERDHHAAIDLRYPDLVHVMTTTHFRNGLTDRDVALARAVSDLAAEREFHSKPLDSVVVEVAIDALDIDAVLPFWQAVLNYVPEHTPADEQVTALIDPEGTGPAFWFQQMDAPRPQRNRLHIDVLVPHDVADQRLADAVAAGGRLVSDNEARAFWVLADVEGNEACICTWQDRDA